MCPVCYQYLTRKILVCYAQEWALHYVSCHQGQRSRYDRQNTDRTTLVVTPPVVGMMGKNKELINMYNTY